MDNVADGDFSEADKIKSLSKDYEIVINAAQSSSGELVSAIIEGLKQRDSKGKLIHITGGGNFLDSGTSGEFNPNSKVWSVSGPPSRTLYKAGLTVIYGRMTMRMTSNRSGRICSTEPQIQCQHSKGAASAVSELLIRIVFCKPERTTRSRRTLYVLASYMVQQQLLRPILELAILRSSPVRKSSVIPRTWPRGVRLSVLYGPCCVVRLIETDLSDRRMWSMSSILP